MFLKELITSGTGKVPSSIRGKPLSDFSALVGKFQDTYSVVVRSNNFKQELATFDDEDSANEFLQKLIKAGAKPATKGWS